MPFIKNISIGASKIPPIPPTNNLYTWGENSSGQLGFGARFTNRSSPVLVSSDVSTVSVSWLYTHYVKNGLLFAMGTNSNGELGDGTRTTRISPTQIGTDNYWYKVSGGVNHTLFISDESGSYKLRATGYGGYGALGNGSTLDRSSPVQVGTETDWIAISAMEVSSLGIRGVDGIESGTLWAWGANFYGELGQSNTTGTSSPVQIGSSTTWQMVSSFTSNVLAVDNGSLYAWGSGTSGEIGNSSTLSRSSPVLINSDGYISISAGNHFCAAIKTDGTLWTWGSNSNGQLGLGNTTNRSSPVQVGTGNTWYRVRCGYGHTLALKSDGTLWAWGDNSNGELGDGTTVSKSSPIQVGSLTTWDLEQEIFDPYLFDAGYNHSGAIEN